MNSLYDLELAFERGLEEWEQKIVAKNAAKMGQKIVREIKAVTPVGETGNLRRRFTSKVEGDGKDTIIRIQNDAEYAAPVNNGHRIVRGGRTVGFVPPFHMVEKGIENYESIYMKEDVENMLKDLQEAMRR